MRSTLQSSSKQESRMVYLAERAGGPTHSFKSARSINASSTESLIERKKMLAIHQYKQNKLILIKCKSIKF